MRLFSLIGALEGAEVITRDGRKVLKLLKWETKHDRRLAGEVDGCASMILWREDGRRFSSKDDPLDLFMKDNDIYEDNSSGPINEYNCDYRIPELMMDLSCQLSRFPDLKIRESLWEHFLEHSPINRPLRPFELLSVKEIIDLWDATEVGDFMAFARAIQLALINKHSEKE